MEEIIKSLDGLIYNIALKFTNDKDFLQDLYQAGVIGAMKAYNNYNDNKEVKFSTFAYKYIYGEMYILSNCNSAIKLNKENVKLYKLIIKTRQLLEQKFNREINLDEISAYLNIPLNKIFEVYNAHINTLSLDYDYEECNGYNFIKSNDNYNEVEINDLLECLSEDERKIINYHYFDGYTQSEIANMMNISQVKVSRTESNGLNKIRTRIR